MSIHWELPGGIPPSQSIGPEQVGKQVDLLFGRDIWLDVAGGDGDLVVTPAGDWKLAEGREALRQSIVRRIMTSPGEWQTVPDFGAGARQFVKARNTRAARDELAARIRAQILRDARVESVEEVVVEALDDGSPGLKVSALFVPRGRGQRAQPLVAAVEVT